MEYTVYTDGSYREVPGVGKFYSSAAIIFTESDLKNSVSLTKCGSDDMIEMRNVAGEMLAVMMALEHCRNVLKLGKNDHVTIYHDYEGLAAWTRNTGEPGYWRAKNEWTQSYRNYIRGTIMPKFSVSFEHVKGHSGNKYNEYVDSLAKRAIEQELLKRLGDNV